MLFSQIVGFDSIIYGKTGVEAEYNSYLQSHTRPAKTLRDLLTHPHHDRQRDPDHLVDPPVAGGRRRRGHRTSTGAHRRPGPWCINVKTGAVEAMYGIPTYDPTRCRRRTRPSRSTPMPRYDPKNAAYSPLVSRTFQRGFLPGSTFKTVTSAAVYDHQPALAKLDIPVAAVHQPRSRSRTSRCATTDTTSAQRCRGMWRRTGRRRSPRRATRRSPRWAWTSAVRPRPQRPRPSASTRSSPSTFPVSGVSSFPTGPKFNVNKPSQAYSAFGQQDVSRHHPADGPGGRRHRQPRGDHDART